jgi:hypothetical protein
VYVAQIFGISDVAGSLMTLCPEWMVFGLCTLVTLPGVFLFLAMRKTHEHVAQNKTLAFTKSSPPGPSGMWKELKSLATWRLRAGQCFIYYMDLRFKGAWVKTSDDAKFWGFLMG